MPSSRKRKSLDALQARVAETGRNAQQGAERTGERGSVRGQGRGRGRDERGKGARAAGRVATLDLGKADQGRQQPQAPPAAEQPAMQLAFPYLPLSASVTSGPLGTRLGLARSQGELASVGACNASCCVGFCGPCPCCVGGLRALTAATRNARTCDLADCYLRPRSQQLEPAQLQTSAQGRLGLSAAYWTGYYARCQQAGAHPGALLQRSR